MSRAEKDTEFQQIMEAAVKQNFSLEQTAKGHWKFTPPP